MELKYGELSSVQSAMLPAVAAICGAALPALIFCGLNAGTEYIKGWAIPMATDIAFVIGIMALLSSPAAGVGQSFGYRHSGKLMILLLCL